MTLFEPTNNLRIYQRHLECPPTERLQQLWVCKLSDQQEWRDVEIVKQEA